MSKMIYDTKAEWDQAVENFAIQTDDAGVTLAPGAAPLVLADDFNDGSRDSVWKGHLTNSLIAAFDPPSPVNEPLGCTNLRTKLAQSFTLPISLQLSELQLKLQGYGINTFSPNLIIEIRTDNGNKPSSTILASKTVPYSSIGPLYGWTAFSFMDTLPTLPANQKLWIVFYTDPVGTSSEHIVWLYDYTQDLANQNLMYVNYSTQQWETQYVPTHDFYFRLSRAIDLNPKPTEANGYLSFEYASTSGSGEHIHMMRDAILGGWELEARFRLRRLAPTFNSGQFILGILQGPKTILDGTNRTDRLIHEFRFYTQNNFNVSYDARMADTGNAIQTSGSANWPNINFTAGFLANDSHIFNLKVTKVGNGLKYLLYHSDNPNNVLLETQVSPDVRTLSGDLYLDMGPTSIFNSAFGVAFDFDYIKLNSQPVQSTTGYLRLRHSFGVNTKLETLEFKRQLPTVGDNVQIQIRSGNTIAELEAASFGAVLATQSGSFDPANQQDLYEKAVLSLPVAKYYDTKITVNRAGASSPTLQSFTLEFTPESVPAEPAESEKEPLTYRRIIDSDNNWNRFVEKSSSIAIINGMATLSAVFQDLFDAFSIGSDWTVYQRNADVFSSLGFLRMNILGADSDAILVKTNYIPTSFHATIRWKVEDLSNMPAGAMFNIFSIFNSANRPVPGDLRAGGLGTSTTHHNIIIRRSKDANGVHRFGFVACRSDGTFVGWNESTHAWAAGTQDQMVPSGKESSLWTFEIALVGGSLTFKAKDDQGAVRFDSSSQPISIKIDDNHPWLVLGDADYSDSPVGTTQLYDSVETDIPTSGATSGFIRFRESLGARGQLGKIKVIPSTLIQTQPAPILVKARSADTPVALANANWEGTSQFVPSIYGNEFDLFVPPGALIEVELDLFSSSPGPEISFMSWEIEPLIDDSPLILSLNAVTKDALVSSAGANTGQTESQATVPNIKDGDPDTQWVSTTGQEGYAVGWSLSIAFRSGTSSIERLVDTIILRNTNIKKITVTLYEADNNNPEVVFTGELLTPDAVITFDPKPTALIYLAIETSQTPNELKTLGEIYAGQLLAALPNFTRYEPKQELIESGSLRTLGGKMVTYRGRDKYSSKWTVSQVSEDLKEQLISAFKDNPVVTFWPEPKFKTREIYDVAWSIEDIPFPYTDLFKNAGRTIEAEMAEI